MRLLCYKTVLWSVICLLWATTLAGCAPKELLEAEYFLGLFEKEASGYGVIVDTSVITVLHRPFLRGRWAQCYGNVLVLNDMVWEQLSNTRRKMVVYHEVGHCICGFAHRAPSLMQSFLPGEQKFSDNEAWYMDEFFSEECDGAL